MEVKAIFKDNNCDICREQTNGKPHIYVGSTAGMRSLADRNKIAAEEIVSNITEIISNMRCPMKPSNLGSTNDGVQTTDMLFPKVTEIISGVDEGFYAWIGANHLLNIGNGEESKKKKNLELFATFDWGGASSQFVTAKKLINDQGDANFSVLKKYIPKFWPNKAKYFVSNIGDSEEALQVSFQR